MHGICWSFKKTGWCEEVNKITHAENNTLVHHKKSYAVKTKNMWKPKRILTLGVIKIIRQK